MNFLFFLTLLSTCSISLTQYSGFGGGNMFSTDVYGPLAFRNHTISDLGYGLLLPDRSLIPRGPKFLLQPTASVFDLSGRSQQNFVQLVCSADGYPLPTYTWYKEEYSAGGQPIARQLNPLDDSRLTLTDGVLTIHSPQQQTDRGKYHCRAGNRYGWIRSHSVQLSFGFIGEFNKKRSADIGRANWGKSISCDAPQHHPAVNYYWVKNRFPSFVEEDQRVFVSQDGNLYFSSLEIIDRANYSCNVQSVISSTGRTGPFFSLVVEPSPNNQKLLFPNSFPKAFPEAPLAGQPVRLECLAFGYPVPTYNWTRRAVTTSLFGPKSFSSSSIVTGSFSSGHYGTPENDQSELPLPLNAKVSSHGRVLQIENVSVADAGEYVCSAVSGREVITNSVTLAVQSLPVFTRPLTDRIVEPGGQVHWTCEAFAIPLPKYNWYRDGELLVPHLLQSVDAQRYTISGNSLSIIHVQAERDAAMYQCMAINQLGAMFSSAQLKVTTVAPLFRDNSRILQKLYVGEQINFTLPCSPEALPAPELLWRRDGIQIVLGGKYRALDTGELLVSPLNLTDSGIYTCRAANELGWAEYSVELHVLSLPRFSKQPSPRVMAVIGDALELPCEAYAPAPLDIAYRWLLNDREVRLFEDGGLPSPSRGFFAGYLRLTNVTFSDSGRYTCEARSAAGSIFAHSQLLVAGPPDAPGALIAEQISASSAKLSWVDGASNGRQIIAYNIEARTNHERNWNMLARYVTTFSSEPSVAGVGRRFVHLREILSPWSTYEFKVAAINELGVGLSSSSSPAYNTDKDRPYKRPANVGGGGGKAGTLTITWDPLPPADWHSPAIWYRLHYRLASERNQPPLIKELRALGNVGMYTVSISPEHYYTAYEVRVQAMNDVGDGPLSEPTIVYSAEAMPQTQPSAVRVEPHNSTALMVSWAPVDSSREKLRGRLIGHRIKYWRNGKDAQEDALTLLNRNEDNHGLIVALLPNTEYYVSVMAYNDAGSGPESEPSLSRTYKSAPQRPPVNVQVYAVDSTTIRVTWRGVSVGPNEEPVIGYKVRYWQTDQPIASAKEAYKYLDGQDLEAIIPGLTQNKTYKLRVLAYSKGGDGKMSSPAWEFKVGSLLSV